MSRLTLHRIERGEPSVTMGAYLGAITALGLDLELADPLERIEGAQSQPPAAVLPETIGLAGYPQLARPAWQCDGHSELTPQDPLNLYERNWRHVDHAAMDAHERDFVERLAAVFGKGRLLV